MCQYPQHPKFIQGPIQNLWALTDDSINFKDTWGYFKTVTNTSFHYNSKFLKIDCSKINLNKNEKFFTEQILYWILREAEKKLYKNEYDILEATYRNYKLEYYWEFERENQFYHFFEELNKLNIKLFLLFHGFNYLSKQIEQSDFQKLYNVSANSSTVHFWILSTIPIDKVQITGEYDKLFYSIFKTRNSNQLYSLNEFERYYDIIQTECSNATIYNHDSVNHKQIKDLISSKIGMAPISLDEFKSNLLYLIQNSEGIHYEEAINYLLNYNNFNMKKQEIFISYAWGDNQEENESRETIVNLIDKTFSEKGYNLIRDKKDLDYKGKISEFEERIGKGNYIILILSDKFLKSKHCMHEVLQIRNNGNIYNRVFPIVLKDALIYNEEERIDYINYWDNEIEKLQKKINTIKNSVAIDGVVKTITLYSDIRRFFDEITTILKDMNTLTPEIHKENDFSQLIEAIEKRNNDDLLDQKLMSDPRFSTKTINQYGQKSLYIENNQGDITIN